LLAVQIDAIQHHLSALYAENQRTWLAKPHRHPEIPLKITRPGTAGNLGNRVGQLSPLLGKHLGQWFCTELRTLLTGLFIAFCADFSSLSG